jgi:predicted O-methyltransferase YrrM
VRNSSARESTSSLDRPPVSTVLERLHQAARGDYLRLLTKLPTLLPMLLGGKQPESAELSRRLKDVYIPISRAQGRFLYLVARAIRAQRIVEFGTSFGISTLYCAAALRDNGGGVVIGSELEPSKHRVACDNLKQAGLDGFAEVRLGDALVTLRDVEAPVDLVLLDGWKDLYLPILELLTPKLRPGALVLGDNIRTFRKALRPYVEYVQSGRNGFHSLTLPLADGFEFSYYEGR